MDTQLGRQIMKLQGTVKSKSAMIASLCEVMHWDRGKGLCGLLFVHLVQLFVLVSARARVCVCVWVLLWRGCGCACGCECVCGCGCGCGCQRRFYRKTMAEML